MGGGNTKGVGGESRSIYILYITYTELKKKKKRKSPGNEAGTADDSPWKDCTVRPAIYRRD